MAYTAEEHKLARHLNTLFWMQFKQYNNFDFSDTDNLLLPLVDPLVSRAVLGHVPALPLLHHSTHLAKLIEELSVELTCLWN